MSLFGQAEFEASFRNLMEVLGCHVEHRVRGEECQKTQTGESST